MKKHIRLITTLSIVIIAILMILYKYKDYLKNPWTRDGQVRAEVIQIAPRVSGPIVNLPIVDNQFVKKGDILFQIDPRTFDQAMKQAKADLDNTLQNVEVLEEEIRVEQAGLKYSKETGRTGKTAIKTS